MVFCRSCLDRGIFVPGLAEDLGCEVLVTFCLVESLSRQLGTCSIRYIQFSLCSTYKMIRRSFRSIGKLIGFSAKHPKLVCFWLWRSSAATMDGEIRPEYLARIRYDYPKMNLELHQTSVVESSVLARVCRVDGSTQLLTVAIAPFRMLENDLSRPDRSADSYSSELG